jgi:hypothetical protein
MSTWVMIGRHSTHLTLARDPHTGYVSVSVHAGRDQEDLVLFATAPASACDFVNPPVSLFPSLQIGNATIPLADDETVAILRAEIGLLQ